ncbi:glycosyltransferase family 1 protein [Paenibacillus sp. FSL P4-0338]|uniref:glycosyltransferase family 1 protein n=1 Tax=Paenibacillus sp. FSL P4-0338 TaxID=2921635 RepID=UPI0030F7F3BD
MSVHESPLRILHVFGIMNCGGAETFIMNVYRNIDREKIQFDFIVHSEDKGYYDDEIKALGGRIYQVPKFSGRNFLNYVKSWKLFLEEHSEYRIIHSHIRSTASIFLRLAKKQGLKTIIHSHSTSSGTGFSAFVKDTLQLPLRYITDYRFACSRAAGEWLFGNEKFDIINNAINSEKYIFNKDSRKLIRNTLGLNGKFVIGHIGRFNAPKNHIFILNVFKKIHELNPNSALLLVGDGDLREELEKKIKELNLMNSVILTGIRNDIPELLHAMDVFLFPSLYEGLGIAVIEAQATGLPCIVSDTLPNEVLITDLVKFISLKESLDYWINEIIATKDAIRNNKFEEIIKSNYDIKDQVKLIKQFYLKNL